jgi:uncharacterized protein
MSDASTFPIVLEWLPGRFAVCRLDAAAAVPAWAAAGGHLVCVTRTATELSIVVGESTLPPEFPCRRDGAGAKAERGWAALAIAGTVDFNLVGILAKLTGALAAAGVPVFVISTFDTDVLMFRERFRDQAVAALATVAQIPPSGPPTEHRRG